VGTLRYTVSGTAQAGTDYVLPTGQLQVNGAQVDIQIGLLDDSVYEETVKTLSISLFYEAGAGLGYGLGTSIEHTVYIRDNDAVWRGQIENGGTVIPVAMRVVRNGAAVSVTLIGDEYGIIPTNSRSAEWPASGVTFTDTHFGAVVAGMTVAASRTLTNLPIRRRFEFVADAATPGHVVDLNARVSGTLTETLTVEGHEYLNRTSTGGFLLLREVPRVDVPEPQLVSAGRIGSR
jgi:hypothetical protein